jgi:beta-xylosidase
MIQKVDSDCITKIGGRIQLLDRSEADGSLIEAPAMFYSNGIYYLFFSSSCYDKTLYDVSYATSHSLTGRFTKASSPLLKTGYTAANVQGPGGCDVNMHGNKLVFHGYLNGQVGVSYPRGIYAIGLEAGGTTLTLGDLY